MKLSIITVNLNNKNGLQKTIDSVVSQTFKDFEWIVIDGGSIDGSRELIEQYADHFAYWVSEPDKGVYNAMNKGIRVAKGEYLQFLNSGDWLWNETALERCFSHGFTADIAYADLYIFRENGFEERCYSDHLSLRFFYKTTVCHNSTFIKRLPLANELYDESLKIVSDWKFFLIQFINNKSFEHINEFVIAFDKSGMSSVYKELYKQERSEVVERILPSWALQCNREMDEMEDLLNLYQVKKVLEFGNKRKLYHKMITGCLMFIGFIDSVFTRKNKK